MFQDIPSHGNILPLLLRWPKRELVHLQCYSEQSASLGLGESFHHPAVSRAHWWNSIDLFDQYLCIQVLYHTGKCCCQFGLFALWDWLIFPRASNVFLPSQERFPCSGPFFCSYHMLSPSLFYKVISPLLSTYGQAPNSTRKQWLLPPTPKQPTFRVYPSCWHLLSLATFLAQITCHEWWGVYSWWRPEARCTGGERAFLTSHSSSARVV